MARDTADKARRSAIAATLLIVESVLVLALGLYMVALGFTHDKDWLPYLSVIAFAFGGSAALYALAWGVKNGRRWANSPAILANLIALGVAKYQFEAGLYWLSCTLAFIATTIVITVALQVKNENK